MFMLCFSSSKIRLKTVISSIIGLILRCHLGNFCINLKFCWWLEKLESKKVESGDNENVKGGPFNLRMKYWMMLVAPSAMLV